jgi:AcrR family transcriptional regulator
MGGSPEDRPARPTRPAGARTAPELAWVRAPQQARSEDTLARLLDAAEVLLETTPWDSITVAALVARARSSVGAFYARFPDKDALLQHLHTRRCTEAIETADAALARERWAGVPLPEVVGAVVAFTAEEYAQRAGFHREMVRRHSVDPRFRERSARVASHTTRLIALLLEERRGEIDVKDTLAAADMIHRMLFSILDQQVQYSDRAPGAIALTPAALAGELCRAILGYLRALGGPP